MERLPIFNSVEAKMCYICSVPSQKHLTVGYQNLFSCHVSFYRKTGLRRETNHAQAPNFSLIPLTLFFFVNFTQCMVKGLNTRDDDM